MKINDPDWFPCYINPEFDELKELAESHWDTVRILVVDDKHSPFHENIILASGDGNTHETLVKNLKKHFNLKRAPFAYDFILYKSVGKPFFNDLSTGRNKVSAESMLKKFTTKQAEILNDLIALSDLSADS